MKTLFATGLNLLFVFAAFAQHHESNDKKPGERIVSQTILTQFLNESGISNKNVTMEVVDFPPLSISPPHRHPCPTFGYVLEGEIESVFEGKTYLYKKGDTFYETTNGLHAAARNPSDSRSARLLVFFIVDNNTPTTISESKK